MGDKIIDKWTLVHFIVGMIANILKLPISLFIILHIIFEIWENTKDRMCVINNTLYRVFPLGFKTEPDSIINRISDILAGTAGWLFMEKINI